MQEIWKPIRGSCIYEVSDHGNIRTNKYTWTRKDGKPYSVKSAIRKPYITRNGYEVIMLGYDLCIRESVHRLVLETFMPIDNMEQYQVNHIDGNKRNNNLLNLEWATREENMQHAMRSGLWIPTYARKDTNPNLKLSDSQVEEIRLKLATHEKTQHVLAIEYGVSDTVISDIKRCKKRFAH